MTAPKPGDRVRVTFEADVEQFAPGVIKLCWTEAPHSRSEHAMRIDILPPDSVTVIRRPLVAGDVTTDGDALNALPVGSIVEWAGSVYGWVAKRNEHGWSVRGGHYGSLATVPGLRSPGEWRVVRVGPA